tara:strand:+ start:294 stop:503 length:210 start_codon:yes stop_codon:yes gene_type:complete
VEERTEDGGDWKMRSPFMSCGGCPGEAELDALRPPPCSVLELNSNEVVDDWLSVVDKDREGIGDVTVGD